MRQLRSRNILTRSRDGFASTSFALTESARLTPMPMRLRREQIDARIYGRRASVFLQRYAWSQRVEPRNHDYVGPTEDTLGRAPLSDRRPGVPSKKNGSQYLEPCGVSPVCGKLKSERERAEGPRKRQTENLIALGGRLSFFGGINATLAVERGSYGTKHRKTAARRLVRRCADSLN